MKTARYMNAQRRAPYLFVAPFFVLFCVFGVYPIGFSIYISLFNWSGASGATEFLGLGNYSFLLATDPFFIRTIWTTFWLMIIGSLMQHVFAIPLSILLNNKFIRGKEFFKTTFFLPYITSTVSVVLIFARLFDENTGLFNALIEALGGTRVRWLTNPDVIPTSLAVMLNWKYIGWNTVIYLAGLMSINPELYEAAEIDGAAGFYKHWRITLPLLMPVIFFSVSLSVIGGMQVFDEPFVLMGGYDQLGGPGNAGLTTALYLMTQGFRWFRFGRGSATAWLLFIIIIVLQAINKRINKSLTKF